MSTRLFRQLFNPSVVIGLLGSALLVYIFFPLENDVDPEQVWGEVVEYGIYDYSMREAYDWNSDVATSPTVYENSKALGLIEQTTRIPIVKNIHFAFKYRIEGFPDGIYELDWSVKHPDMDPNKSGNQSYWYSYKRSVESVNGIIEGRSGYILNRAHEMVPGKWQFTYMYKGKVLVAQTFTTYMKEKQ